MQRWLLLLAIPVAAADWPQILGPTRSGVSHDTATVSGTSPRLLWKKSVGAGFSGPAVAGNRVVLFHRVESKATVESLDSATGTRQWIFESPTTYRDDFGFDEGPRAVPTIAGERVFTFGADGILHALDLKSGRMIWRVDTASRFAVRKGFFGAAGSPLVANGLVYLNVGGPNNAGLVALDAATGEVRWAATNDDASYSSPITATLDGVRSILFFTRQGLVAVDPAKGSLRFRFPWRSRTNASVNAAIPVVSGDRIFLSTSYNTGAVVLEAKGNAVRPLWSGDESLSNHYATSVLKDGYLYGFHGRQEMGQSFRCIEFATGKVKWSTDGFGAGSVLLAGTRLLVVRENGELVIVAASPGSYQKQGSSQLLPAVIRAFPALSNGVLFVRNENTLGAWRIDSARN
ncbi:MAG: PQQ-binding-like beta-propeller repeat protein [Bryobacteraceae bacterium]|nr:PQQ-binding-like beta-propeller repeat protein [Bryobacteraceae bacterium]